MSISENGGGNKGHTQPSDGQKTETTSDHVAHATDADGVGLDALVQEVIGGEDSYDGHAALASLEAPIISDLPDLDLGLDQLVSSHHLFDLPICDAGGLDDGPLT